MNCIICSDPIVDPGVLNFILVALGHFDVSLLIL